MTQKALDHCYSERGFWGSRDATVLRLSLVCLTVAAVFAAQPLQAQDESSASSSASTVDQVEAEFNELLIRNAMDFSSPSQETLIRLAVRRKLIDDRFNRPIRETLDRAVEANGWEKERIERALEMVPLSNLEPEELCDRLFKCYLLAGDDRERSRVKRSMMQILGKHPDRTSWLVLGRMREGDFQESLFPLIGLVGASSEEQLPLLLQAARGDDPEQVARASDALDNLIRGVRRYQETLERQKQERRLGIEGLDSKFVKYAERIVSRYDRNQDGKLDSKEYGTMLMSPKEADSDGDGTITVAEYARWMEQRSKP